jgi:Uncharacterised BCR, YnfA/UPF0060 family
MSGQAGARGPRSLFSRPSASSSLRFSANSVAPTRSGAGSAPARPRSSGFSEPPHPSATRSSKLSNLNTATGDFSPAYTGVFLIGAMFWGWGVDGKEPDRFDWLGASIVLLDATVILWGGRIFA